jgi:Protein CHAPERONE-LIKE PROTEIN OF POR1-like
METIDRRLWMSQQSPYEQLGVSQDATFEEIQAAKQRVLAQLGGDDTLQNNIEAAYDAILMERLKLRQQNKLKVPEEIRFPEKLLATVPKFTPPSLSNSQSWLGDTFERPDRSALLTTSSAYALLAGAALVPRIADTGLPTIMALGTGFSLYFINQKQRRFKRALLGSLLALVVGMLVSGLLVNYARIPVGSIGLHGEIFAALVTFLCLWVVSSFTK